MTTGRHRVFGSKKPANEFLLVDGELAWVIQGNTASTFQRKRSTYHSSNRFQKSRRSPTTNLHLPVQLTMIMFGEALRMDGERLRIMAGKMLLAGRMIKSRVRANQHGEEMGKSRVESPVTKKTKPKVTSLTLK